MRSRRGSTDRSPALLSRSVLAVALVVVLLLPGPALAAPVGIRVGDKAVFQAKIVQSVFALPKNNVSTFTVQFTLLVLAVGNSTIPGQVAYNLTITNVNGTESVRPTTTNYSTIFDPLENTSYIGNAFFPFTYTDLHNGSVIDMPVRVPINLTIPGSSPVLVNASVVRTPSITYVGVVVPLGLNITTPAEWYMKYNTTTGVLENSTVHISEFGTTRDFYYTLLSYKAAPPGRTASSLLVPTVAAVVVVVAALAVFALARRPSKRERETLRMKEKFGKKG